MLLKNYADFYTRDPYFQDAYLRCYLNANEEIFHFTHRKDNQHFECKAIKRPVPEISPSARGLFDLETVYGYGGYVCKNGDDAFVSEALARLEAYCREERIVAHFMRFHPLNDFPLHFGNQLDFKAENRVTVFVPIADREYSAIKQEYSSSLKRNINKAKRLGLEVRKLTKSAGERKTFQELYWRTMERKDADSLYFFSADYFEKLFNLDLCHCYATFLEDQVISMIITLEAEGRVYYHLGATDPDYYQYNPNPFIMNHRIQHLVAEGGQFYFLGGGNSLAADDPLFRFKKKFSPHQESFYIGGKIFMPDAYQELKNGARKKGGELPKMFLAYRFV